MVELNPTMLKTLAITPDGNCAKHPTVALLSPFTSEETDTHPPALQECEYCWKEQQERKNYQSGTDLTMTTSTSMSPSEICSGAVPPPILLQTVPSGTTLPSGSSKSTEAAKKYAEWSDAVMMRWHQVQDIGIGSGNNMRLTDMDESTSSRSIMLNGESWHGSGNLNPSHAFNMSMAAVAEEPDERLSQPSQSFHTAGVASSATTAAINNNAPWKRLEEQVERQQESIQKLQETVQRQEVAIRQDLQTLMEMVSNLAASGLQHAPQQHQSGNAPDQRDICVEALETPTASNRQSPEPHQTQQSPAGEVQSPQRPTMYKKSDHHPANMFTSVRTIERKPPKPPMRHGSFSTAADSRRQSVSSTSNLASIISSLGNSTTNDGATYNETSTTHNDNTTTTPTPNTIATGEEGHAGEPTDKPATAGYESMLERARSKPLEIIFDASGRINSDFLHAKEEADAGQNNNGEDEEKKSASRSGSPNNNNGRGTPSPTTLRQSNSSDSADRRRESFRKSPGKLRLAIRGDDDAEVEDEHDKAVNHLAIPNAPNLRSRSESPMNSSNNNKPAAPARIQRKVTPPFQSNTRNGSHRPVRQPRRELSVTDVTTEKAANRKTSPGRADVYVPPQPPPSTPNHYRGGEETSARQSTTIGRLHPSNLSKLGVSTAPPRREIFATGSSKLQISCLTLDTSLMTHDNEPYNANTGIKYRDVTNLAVTDKFGDKGIYTGTLREEEMEEETAPGQIAAVTPRKRMVGIPHGTGTMKYEGGRFYKGSWRDGHWHGDGLLRNANGDSYEGEFVYDARHGRGIYKYENGDVYEGDFTEDKRHGKGTFLFHNGSVYRGDFVNGDFEGYGWYEFDDGYYEGEWKGGAYHGIGTLQYTDGGSYTGRFFEGKAHGHGEEKDADGTIRRGVWNKGELSGNQ